MKKVININFQGRVVMIEEEAYENLKVYIESLRKHFAGEEGSDEIINDIENRISELFAEVIKKGNPCVSEADLDAIIHSIGRPEDFEDEENAAAGNTAAQAQAAQSQSQQSSENTTQKSHRQFFRDETNKKIGGVCAGLANFFNVDVTWVRLIALILLVFYGVGFIPYIILWIAVPSSATQVIGSSHKRLYRDLSHKTIGGVCAGLASYFNVSIWVPKVIFLIGALCSFPISWAFRFHPGPIFFPGVNGFFVTLYIILWAVIPAAVTASERLSMKGENVDLNSIKNTVQEDLSDGKKSKKKVNSTAMNNNNPAQELIPVKDRSTLGTIIATLFKVFAYFILGCILFAVICALGGIGIAAFGVLPLKGYLIGGAWQNTLAILTIVLGIWLPVIGIIIWIIRSLMRTKVNRYLRMSFIVLWLIGVMSFAGLLLSLHNDVRYDNTPVVQNISISNPKVQKLEINYTRVNRPFRFSRHWIFGRSSYSVNNTRMYHDRFPLFDDVPYVEDAVLVNNTTLQFIPAINDSFSVDMAKYASGSSTQQADAIAGNINYSGIVQQDTMLTVPSYFALNQTDKFRNQFVVIRISVPVGKKIIVRQNDGYSNKIFLGFPFFTDDDGNDDFYNDWDFDREYIMTKDGLKATHVDMDNDDNNNSNNTIINTQDSIEAAKQRIEQQQKTLEEEKKHLQEMNKQKKQNLEKQIQQLKQDSEQVSAMNIRFDSPVLLLGKALMKMM